MNVYKGTLKGDIWYELLEVIQRAVGQGITEATKEQLLNGINRRESHSFRKALVQLEYDSAVTKKHRRTSAGGRIVIYELHPEMVQLPMTEPPI